jgi:RNA polymerase sigma-70 factor, ECF subfamily
VDTADTAKHRDALSSPCKEAPSRAALSATVGRLVHTHRQRLAAVARAEGLVSEDVFDAVQEAFEKFLELPTAWDAAADVATDEDAGRVLVAVIRNIARNRRRLHGTARPHVSQGAEIEALAADAPTAEERLLAREEQGRLAGCMSRLADVQRAVVRLRMLEERPGQDVARMLDVTPAHVAVLLYRAKANLCSCMGGDGAATFNPVGHDARG